MTQLQACPSCGGTLPDIPLCYGAAAPWPELGLTENDFQGRVELTDDQCVVDDKFFFIRGHVDIPIIGSSECFSWSVWCSLSEKSFAHMTKRWRKRDRINDPPYFGWLMTRLPGYPETLHLETKVQSREVGRVPLVTIERPEHPLAIEQQRGITRARIAEIAHIVLHAA